MTVVVVVVTLVDLRLPFRLSNRASLAKLYRRTSKP